MNELELLRRIHDLERRAARQEAHSHGSAWVYLNEPLESSKFDGDAHSTEAKTEIDWADFSFTINPKAVLVRMLARDSASASSTGLYAILSPNNTAGSGALTVRPSGVTNDYLVDGTGVVPCSANGKIYYQIVASGASTFDLWIQVWGYCLP